MLKDDKPFLASTTRLRRFYEYMHTVFDTVRKANKPVLNDYNWIILYVPGGY